MLLLDSFDNLEPSKATDRFLRALPASMPSHVQIVINARLLRLQPWNDLIHSGQAVVVGNEEALGGGIYGEDQRLGQLEVFALSGGHVYIDGQPVTSWDGSLPKHLFYFFVDHPMVTRDDIFNVFWPNMSIKEATNVFHVTKRKISERLGYELTNYSGGFYVPSVRLSVHYDVRLFENAVHDAIEIEEDAPANWYQAVQLYRQDFLPEINMPWVQARREVLQHKYAQALIGLGRYHRALGELDHSLGYLLRALREKPDWEDVHRDVMLIYYQQGRRDEAVEQYQQLSRTLQRMFGIQPSKDTRGLYEVITAI
jgi:two-component SAPR family response regulator